MKNSKSFKEALMAKFSKDEVCSKTLHQYSDVLAKVNAEYFPIKRVWWLGQPPFLSVKASTTIPADDLKKLVDVGQIDQLTKFEVFPYGILNPDLFRVDFQFGGVEEQIRNF